jgi:peptidoglycan/LPS O-acetylase OafA/YrhL
MLICANAAVGLFFVLSGFVLTRGWDGRLGVFLVRRFLRLWPVYAVCLGAGYLIAQVHPVWSEFFWYPFIGPNDRPAIDPPVWSLCLEAYAMPFMPLIVWAGSSSLIRAALCIMGLLLASLAAPPIAILGLFIAGAYFARADFRSRVLESVIPQWLGRVSYSLYLSHFLVLELAVRAFGPWAGIAAIPLAFGVAWLVWAAIERPSIWASRSAGRVLGEGLAAARRRAVALGHGSAVTPNP